MSQHLYQADPPATPFDALILAASGPEPLFDSVTRAFLHESYLALKRSCERGGLLEFVSLGQNQPWLFRLTFHTRGFKRASDGSIAPADQHVVALRFLPGYLRYADRFAMLRLIEPIPTAFHPNISPSGAICVEIYPGESLVEICQSLHDLIRWRLRQYDERDALNSAACAWGRENISEAIDDRPLFGQGLKLHWQPSAGAQGATR